MRLCALGIAPRLGVSAVSFRCPRLVASVLCAGLLLVSVASAQPDRRPLFESLLQSLIETQLERHVPPRAEPPRGTAPASTAQLQRASDLLAAFADESAHVLEAMQADTARAPGVRPLLGEMLRLRADATVLSRQASALSSLEPMVDSVRELDRRWRLISHRLGQMEGLSQDCLRCASELTKIDQELCRLFQIQAQIDGRELLRLANSLSAAMTSLVEDIEIELGRTADGRRLLVESRRVQQQARYFSDTISREPSYETIVAEFRKFHDAYAKLAVELWPLENRYLERSMRRIEETNREVHTLLWLPVPLNLQQLNHLTAVLTQRVDELFDKVTLKMLVASPSAANVLNTASQFHGCCEHFAWAVKENGTPAELRREFQYMQEAWPELARCFRGVHDPAVDQLLKEIEQTYLSMRAALQIQSEFDRRAAVELAATLESQLEHLLQDVRIAASRPSRDDPNLRMQAVRSCQSLCQSAGSLHQDLAGNREVDHVRDCCTQLHRDWSQFHDQYLDKLPGQDGSHVHETAEQVTALLVQLQTLMLN